MDTVYESTLVEQPMSNRIEGATKLIRMRSSLWQAAEMLEGFAGVLAVLYLLGAVVFGVALLFYTFSR